MEMKIAKRALDKCGAQKQYATVSHGRASDRRGGALRAVTQPIRIYV